jgi:DNA-binding transcriptional regulator GbsR (MarR family)
LPDRSSVEEIRRSFARAWGEIGAAWGVAPSTATVQGYLLAHGGPLTEPEVRRALGLSHRAASLALGQCEEWGLIHRAPGARRSGQRGPAAIAWEMVGDHWEWFRRVAAARRERETDPVIPVLQRCVAQARAAETDDAGELESRLASLLEFVQRFDRGVEVIVSGEPQAIASVFATPAGRPHGGAAVEAGRCAGAIGAGGRAQHAGQAAAGRGAAADRHRREARPQEAAGPPLTSCR